MKKRTPPSSKITQKARTWRKGPLVGMLVAAVGLAALTQVPWKNLPSLSKTPPQAQVEKSKTKASGPRLSLASKEAHKPSPKKKQKAKEQGKSGSKKVAKTQVKKQEKSTKKLSKANAKKNQKQLAASKASKSKKSVKSQKPSLAMQAR